MNGFLSTTLSRETALKVFAGAGENRPNQPYHESVLFEFCIDEATIKRTYADISAISQYPEEEEVLFTIGSIWRIDSVEKHNDLYWIVQLSSCNDISLKIVQFYEQLTDDSTFLMLGDVLRELGQNTKAENFYHKMLKDPNIEDDTRITLYYNIAMINMEQEKYPAALEYLHKAKDLIPSITINRDILAFQSLYSYSDVPSSIHIFNNMGFLYQKIDESDNALKYFNEALNIERSDQIDKATVYDNIGLLYYTKGDYHIAVKYLSEAVKLAQDDSSLPIFKQHYDNVNQHLL